jgi:hypothetical protein
VVTAARLSDKKPGAERCRASCMVGWLVDSGSGVGDIPLSDAHTERIDADLAPCRPLKR